MKILVLETHALHLGYLGCYGNEWVATPYLDRLAAEGIVFDHHYTGPDRSPPRADALEGFPLAPDILSLSRLGWEEIKDSIVAAVARIADTDCGLVWADLPRLDPPWDVPDDVAQAYFDEEDDSCAGPWLDPPLGPLDEPSSGWTRLRNTYAAVVTCFDAELGSVIEELDSRGLWHDLLVCVTASSGLPLGEHGFVGPYRAWMHEESWHVPLLVKLPGAAQAGGRISALTQPADLLATVLGVHGLSAEAVAGHNLLSLVNGEVSELRPHAVGGLRIGDSMEWALRTRQWSFLLPVRVPAGDPPRPPQLYVKPDDRWEVNNVRQHHLELAEQLEQTLREIVERHA